MTLSESAVAQRGAGPPVSLSVPAERRYLRMVRLLASSAAADLGFDIDSIEDLRVLVDEACAALIEVAVAGASMEIAMGPEGDGVRLSGTCANNGSSPQLHPVAAEIIDLLADEVGFDAEGGLARFTLLKRRRSSPA